MFAGLLIGCEKKGVIGGVFKAYSWVSISTDDGQNTSTLFREVGYFFPLNWKLEIKY